LENLDQSDQEVNGVTQDLRVLQVQSVNKEMPDHKDQQDHREIKVNRVQMVFGDP
jgi:hypothetical protein